LTAEQGLGAIIGKSLEMRSSHSTVRTMRYWAIDLSILVRVSALLLVSGFSACSSGRVGAQASADSLRSASASILAPTDVADPSDAAREAADPFEKMNRSVFESTQQIQSRRRLSRGQGLP